MGTNRHTPPADLGERGRELWQAVVGDLPDSLEYEGRELAQLRMAARLADDLALIEQGIAEHGAVTLGSVGQVRANPLIGEARQIRLAIDRILARLRIVEPADPRAQRYGRAGALARWHAPRQARQS
jgi:hypothetical protein